MSLRDAMSCFATGVTVVTARYQDADWGMTCNSFNTVSLDPALVLWSVGRSAHSHEAFVKGGGYLVNVLEQSQAQLALQFSRGTQAQRFAGLQGERAASGRLRLPRAVAWFDCRLWQVLPAGDHDILIGEIQDFGTGAGRGLAYARRQFGTVEPLPA